MALADASGESAIPILAPTKVHLVSAGPSAAHAPLLALYLDLSMYYVQILACIMCKFQHVLCADFCM